MPIIYDLLWVYLFLSCTLMWNYVMLSLHKIVAFLQRNTLTPDWTCFCLIWWWIVKTVVNWCPMLSWPVSYDWWNSFAVSEQGFHVMKQSQFCHNSHKEQCHFYHISFNICGIGKCKFVCFLVWYSLEFSRLHNLHPWYWNSLLFSYSLLFLSPLGRIHSIFWQLMPFAILHLSSHQVPITDRWAEAAWYEKFAQHFYTWPAGWLEH